MTDGTKLAAEIRDQFGKGAARKLRAAGKVPAVIYGHGTEPRHITLPAHETSLILRKANAVLDLDIDGKHELTLVKDVQKDPVRQIIEHIDLLVVKKGEKVQVEVPVHVEGESFSGTIVQVEHPTITLEAEATHIPESVSVNVEGAEEGTHITAGDIQLPKGTALVTDAETLVVNVTAPAKAAEVETEAEEAVEAAVEAEAAE